MPWGGILAVGGGAAMGAWLRWGLGVMLNPVFPTLPLGTLSANLIGGLLMGFAMEIITRHAIMSPEMQLLATTGFLGGLTTFSTFSAEIVTLLLRREYLWGTIAIASHVVGSLALTVLGILVVRVVYAWAAA
ncbi:MAG: fluoride efflux transporter CrcB [Betaproteobacteria bacterium]|jgi:CrcB protein|nr:MAG: fluoride efflux transporter CrcB [Betaproteobacteria bacterium]